MFGVKAELGMMLQIKLKVLYECQQFEIVRYVLFARRMKAHKFRKHYYFRFMNAKLEFGKISPLGRSSLLQLV
jgi:hypothetical protein